MATHTTTARNLSSRNLINAAVFCIAAAAGYVSPTLLDALSSAHAVSSKLGDLSGFRKSAANIAALIEQDDLMSAKSRIKILEMNWDNAKDDLEPRAPKDWHIVDKAINRALNAVRANPANTVICKQALTDLLNVLDQMAAQRAMHR